MRKFNEKASLDKNTEHNHRATLFGLPTEILLKIFRYVPGADAARAGRACKASYVIAHTSPVKEKIQLARDQSIQIVTSCGASFIWRNFSNSCVVAAIGDNRHGRLGLKDTKERNIFTRVPLPENFVNVVQIAASQTHTVIFGVDAQGSLLIATCGENDGGQLGNGTGIDEYKSMHDLRSYYTSLKAAHEKEFRRMRGDVADADERLPEPCSTHEKIPALTKPEALVNSFSLIKLPENLSRIFQITATNSKTIVYGIDTLGNPAMAATCHRNILTLTPLHAQFANVLHVGVDNNAHRLISGVDNEGRPVLASRGNNHSGQLGTGDREGRRIFTQVEIPLEFVKVNQLIFYRQSSIVCGEDVRGRPLMACAGDHGGLLEMRDNLERDTFRLVKLPEEIVHVNRVIVDDYKGFMICGRDSKGRPLLAVNGGENHLRFGIPDSVPENTFALVYLPRAFSHVDQVVICGESPLICGTDAGGNPLLIAACGYSRQSESRFTLIELPESFARVIQLSSDDSLAVAYGVDAEGSPLLAIYGKNYSQQDKFNLIALPECLQPQFRSLLENEEEQQHESDASEESFARHNV